jgi:hypothetical protein
VGHLLYYDLLSRTAGKNPATKTRDRETPERETTEKQQRGKQQRGKERKRAPAGERAREAEKRENSTRKEAAPYGRM